MGPRRRLRPLRLDAHQHLLTEPFLVALERREDPPRARRREGRWVLELEGERPHPVDPRAEDPELRARQLSDDGFDRALVALSSVLGVESLGPAEARRLIAAHEEGMARLPEAFATWGSLPLAEPDPAGVDAILDRGNVGLVLPAGALSTPAALERRDAPLFVHPGPAAAPGGAPPWWPALTGYLAETAAAWHAFASRGRSAHPRLRVLFAVLAGGAPLHAERLEARGGPGGAIRDRGLHYDISSYGPRAVSAIAEMVGIEQLVYGSDRPVVDPPAPRSGVIDQVAGTGAERLLPHLEGAG